MPIEGVDYAFPPRPSPAALVAAGKKFVVRYGGPGTSDKQLDLAEANALASAGLWIVANAEGSSGGLLGGFGVGASWARTADAHFRACGMPADRPIYLSIDFDVTSAQWPSVRDALSGAASEVGLARVGVYGGRKAVAWARRDEVASWFWQTYAWSGGVWEPGTHLQQYRNGVTIDGADCDLNRAMQEDYGQWMPGYDGDYGPGGGMSEQDSENITYMAFRLEGLVHDRDQTLKGQDYPGGEELEFVHRAKRIEAKVDAILEALSSGGGGGTGLTADEVRAIVREELDKTKLAG